MYQNVQYTSEEVIKETHDLIIQRLDKSKLIKNSKDKPTTYRMNRTMGRPIYVGNFWGNISAKDKLK